MTTTQKLMPPPKLRASCDECGVAKVKCDRGQPSCNRCMSIGVTCVYGICRKAGKPRRVHRPAVPGTPESNNLLSSFNSDNMADADSQRSSTGHGNVSYTSSMGPGHLLDASQNTDPWNAIEAMHLDMFDFDADNIIDRASYPPTPLGTSPSIGDYGLSSTQVPAVSLPPPRTQSEQRDRISNANPCGHSCVREIYDILISLPPDVSVAQNGGAFFPSSATGTTSASAPMSAMPAMSATPNIPPLSLDHALSLYREASRKLGPLITCSCSRSPHLVLLYASVISRILLWYHQAVIATRLAQPRVSRSDVSLWRSDTESRRQSPPSYAGSTSRRRSIGSETLSSRSTLSSETSASFATPGMAIGSFCIDDARVQAAIQLQLLSGEIRRVGALIEQFTSLTVFGLYGASLDDDMKGSTGSLYQQVALWLKGIHSSLTNTTRAKLRELESQ